MGGATGGRVRADTAVAAAAAAAAAETLLGSDKGAIANSPEGAKAGPQRATRSANAASCLGK